MKQRASLLVLFSVFVGVASAQAGMVATLADPDGSNVRHLGDSRRGGLGFCVEAEDLNPPQCSSSEASCIAEAPDGACVRAGFLFRLTLCAEPGANEHEGHPFSWETSGALPPALTLIDPFGTSTAYVGGDIDDIVPPDPPRTNGKHFGRLTDPFCGQFSVSNDDDCANGDLHEECSTTFVTHFRTLDVDALLPFPVVDGVTIDPPILGQPISGSIDVVGGIENYIFTLEGGELPDGVTLESDGTFSGTPTETGLFELDILIAEDPTDPIFVNPSACALAPACPPESLRLEVDLRIFASGSTTTSSSTTTTSSSTTTTLCPFPSDVCGQPINPDRVSPLTSDCLHILRAAVGSVECCLCPCDADSSGRVLASDALLCLRKAVGLDVELGCEACPGIAM